MLLSTGCSSPLTSKISVPTSEKIYHINIANVSSLSVTPPFENSFSVNLQEDCVGHMGSCDVVIALKQLKLLTSRVKFVNHQVHRGVTA